MCKYIVIASVAKQSRVVNIARDCFVTIVPRNDSVRTRQKIKNSIQYLRKAKFKDNLINSCPQCVQRCRRAKQNEFAQIRDCDLGGFGKLKKIWQQKHLTDQNFT